MAKELKQLDVSNQPELLAIAEQVHESGEARLLRRADEELAVLTPVPRPRRRSPRALPLTREDALWNIVGIGESDGPGDVAANKHRYLAEAYAAKGSAATTE